MVLLDGEIQVTSRSKGAVQIDEDVRPVLGCDVLHRVDGHHGVESLDEGELLQADVLEVDGDAAALRLGQHVGRLVDTDDPVPGRCDDGKVAAGAARCVEHDPVIRAQREQPLDPGLLWPVRVGVAIEGRRFGVVGDDDRCSPFVDPLAPFFVGVSQVVVHRFLSAWRVVAVAASVLVAACADRAGDASVPGTGPGTELVGPITRRQSGRECDHGADGRSAGWERRHPQGSRGAGRAG